MASGVAGGPRWRGQRDTRGRVFKTLLVLSVLLHVPLTPLGALLGLVALLDMHETPKAPDLGEIEGIPVTLLSDDELEALGIHPSVPEPGPKEEPAEPTAPEPAAPPEPGDDADDLAALFDDEPPKPEKEPEAPKSAPSAKAPSSDGGAEAPPSTDGGAPLAPVAGDAGATPKAPPRPPVSDPGALAGGAASVADPNANVKLLLLNDRIARHPAGPRIGALLRRVPQWRSFFGPSGLDPIRDLSRVYVAGPQFRESAEVVAVLEYTVEEARMRAAIDAIVHRKPEGKWLKTKVPAATGHADRAERTFILPRSGIVVMVPPRLTDDTIAKSPGLRFPNVNTDAAVVAFINTPWRVLIGFNAPVKIPESIATLMVEVVPSPDGGVRVRVRAIDASPEKARDHASVLERGINLLTQRDMGMMGSLLFGSSKIELLKPIKLRAEGKVITGSAEADARQVDRMLNFVESWLDAVDNRQRIEASSRRAAQKPPTPAPRTTSSATTASARAPTAAPSPRGVPKPAPSTTPR